MYIYYIELMSCQPLPPPLCGDQSLTPLFHFLAEWYEIRDTPLRHARSYCQQLVSLKCKHRYIINVSLELEAGSKQLARFQR